MALQYTVSPRNEAGSVRILEHEESGSSTSSGGTESYNLTVYGWDSLTEHPLWRFVNATWTWTDTFTNYDGEVLVYPHSVSSSMREIDPSVVMTDMLYEGVRTNVHEYLGTSRHEYRITDMTFNFVHSQSGKIIRTTGGVVMRSADGIVFRDN